MLLDRTPVRPRYIAGTKEMPSFENPLEKIGEKVFENPLGRISPAVRPGGSDTAMYDDFGESGKLLTR